MTHSQFQTFMQQLDASLAEIGHEMSEDEATAENCRLFLMSLNRRMRQGFIEISKQISAEGANAREASPVDLYYQNQEWLQGWKA